jgi:hypothetical protein
VERREGWRGEKGGEERRVERREGWRGESCVCDVMCDVVVLNKERRERKELLHYQLHYYYNKQERRDV